MGSKLYRTIECRAGMVLAKDVYNQKGVILIPTDTVLTDLMIDRIMLASIPAVWIVDEEPYTEPVTEDSLSMKKTKKDYTRKIEKIKNIFSNFTEGNSLEEDAREISSSVVNSDKSSGDLLRCMRQLRSINDYTYQHSLNVASLCYLIGHWMKVPQVELEELTLAGLIHDIGKTKIDPKILYKNTELTGDEAQEIQKHSEYGHQILKNHTQYSDNILKAVLMHHEKEDGSGYPSQLKSKDIHPYAKVIAVADLYSAITLDRVYKRTDTPFSVFEIFESSSAQKFDPLVVYTLINNIAMYYIGDKVRLTNGMVGRIVFIDQEFVSRPLIHCQDGSTLDLRVEKTVKIAEIFI